MLVGVELHRSFLALELDRQDLALEVTGGNRRRGAFVALNGKRILLLARDAALGGDILGGHAHVDGVERIGQRAHHRVKRLGVPHARTPALRQIHVRRAAHALGAAGHRGVDVAEEDVLRCGDDRLQAAAAQAIERQRARSVGQAAVDASYSRQIHVLGLAVDHVAEYALADVVGIDLGAANGLSDNARRELRRRNILQAATVITDGGTHAA